MRTAVVAIMITVFALGAISSIAMIGKEREPVTPVAAIFSTIFAVVFILGILYLA
jgi:hypothetical protein